MLDELLSKIRSYNPNSDVEKITKAYNFTKECHEGQFRILGNLILFIQWLLLIF